MGLYFREIYDGHGGALYAIASSALALLGPEAPGLSATTITRLQAVWEEELASWQHPSLAGQRYIYVWASTTGDI